MKQNKRGFTLIELLAVIVILAIIALIAVPVIMNIIASARKSAFEDTAYGLISAGEMYYAESLLDSGMTSDVEFTISNGEFAGTNKLEVKGSLPTSGKIKVTTDGKVALAIINGDICITKGYDDSKIETLEEFEACELASTAKKLSELAKINDFAESVDACASSGTCSPGTKFAIEVVPGNIQNFYVVSDVDNKVTLIMDRNLGDFVAWNTSGNNTDGPITALNYLESGTTNWTNIEANTYTLTDSKYGTITRTNARARMLTQTEAVNLECSDGVNSCPTWAYSNLGTEHYGYWLSSASADSSSQAWTITDLGSVLADSVTNVGCEGVRPVIELSK